MEENRVGFQPGHPRYAGRRPGSPNKRTRAARELIEKLEAELGTCVDPFERLLRISLDARLSLDMQVDILRSLLPYLLPRLQATSTAVTAAFSDDNGEVVLDIGAILTSPELTRNAEALALALSDAQAPAGSKERADANLTLIAEQTLAGYPPIRQLEAGEPREE